jgi:hypothetical protein
VVARAIARGDAPSGASCRRERRPRPTGSALSLLLVRHGQASAGRTTTTACSSAAPSNAPRWPLARGTGHEFDAVLVGRMRRASALAVAQASPKPAAASLPRAEPTPASTSSTHGRVRVLPRGNASTPNVRRAAREADALAR